MRVLVCGGRTYGVAQSERHRIYNVLYDLCDEFELWGPKDEFGNCLPGPITIISGEAKGADSVATDWAMINETGYQGFPADWDKHGRAAGPIRNKQVLDEGKPDLVLAFPGGRGTEDMMHRARMAGVEVREIS